MASTAGQILDYAWKILRTNGSSTDVPALQESFMLTLLSNANMEWLRAHKRGGGSGPLMFLRETGFDLIADTALAEDTDTGETEVTVDESANFETTGAFAVWDDNSPDLATFTGNAADVFSGVDGLAYEHEDGDVVQALYKLPANFKAFRPSHDYGDGVRVNGVPYFFRESTPVAGYFTQRDFGSDKYLWLPRGVTGSASVLFEKTSATLDSTDDTVDVPQEFEMFLVWRMIETATIPKEGGEVTQLYIIARDQANRTLQEALNAKSVGQHVRVRQFGRTGRDPSFTQRVPR